MAKVPPQSFYKLTKEEQEVESVLRMNKHYLLADQWKKLSIEARKHQIEEPKEIDRPDLLDLKS